MYTNTGKSDSADQFTAFTRRPRFANPLKRFAKDDSGAMLIFGVYIFVLILMVGGIGIDLMRFERDRAKLQSTLDRAVLAAADLDQTLDPKSVVEDYFNKAGLSEFLVNVPPPVEGIGYRIVSAEAAMTVETQFMRLTGIDSLVVPAVGTAEERIDGVEISLVLDVSGSMGFNNNSRLKNLKVAARDFIDTMMSNSIDGKVSISIVPYATQVSAPAYLFDELTVSQEHDYSRCINFTSTDYATTKINPDVEMQRTMHFDPWDNRDGRGDAPKKLVTSPVCEADPNREMMVLQKDAEDLKTFISNLEAKGNTSIDVGMKWGAALLDPSLQTVVTKLIADKAISGDFAQRPNNYNDGETIKVIVLMTDGQNTSQYYIEDDYRTGDSNIWWNDELKKYSVYIGLDEDDKDFDGITNEPMFFWPDGPDGAGDWHDHAYGIGGTYDKTTYDRVCQSYRRNGSCRWYQTVATTSTVAEQGLVSVLSYADLWAYTSMKWNVYNHYYPWMYSNYAWYDWIDSVKSSVGTSTKNARTKAICSAAKDNSVLIYTIAFEAPSSGQAVLKDCASSVSHFFSVSGVEIVNAFDAIASSIRQLRLTQ